MTAFRANAAVTSKPFADHLWKWGTALGLALSVCLVADQSRADSHEKIITSHGFSSFGTLKYEADFEHLDYVNPDAPKGGEISTARQGTFDSMNPYSRKGRAPALSVLPQEDIMVAVADDPYGVYCLLCETIEYPESQDWVIFNLRPEAQFSDGTFLKAEDIKFSVDLILEQGLPSYREAVKKRYKSIEVLDDHRIKFTFQPDIPRKGLIHTAAASPVWSKAWFDKTGARLDETMQEFSPGTGPYVIDVVENSRRIIARRNPDYWGKDLPINKGRHNFDTIREEYFSDDTAAFEAFKSGVYTFRQETSSIKWATGYDFPALTKGFMVKKELENGALPAATGLMFNLRREIFQDVRVRQALALMYNFTWTNETLQYGLFAQRESFWQYPGLMAEGVPEGLELEYLTSLGELIDPKILTEPAVRPHESSNRQLDRGNLREASRLLDEAGWTVGSSGFREKDGKRLSIELMEDNPSFDRILQPYVENLKRLGVDMVYSRIDPAQYTNRRRAQDWDMIYHLYRNSLEEGGALAQRYGSEDAEYSLFNVTGYSSPAVDQMIEIVRRGTTLEEMQAGVRAVDRILRYEQIMIPTWYNDTYWVAYFDIFEHPDQLPPLALGHYDFWWYNDEKAAELKAKGAF